MDINNGVCELPEYHLSVYCRLVGNFWENVSGGAYKLERIEPCLAQLAAFQSNPIKADINPSFEYSLNDRYTKLYGFLAHHSEFESDDLGFIGQMMKRDFELIRRVYGVIRRWWDECAARARQKEKDAKEIEAFQACLRTWSAQQEGAYFAEDPDDEAYVPIDEDDDELYESTDEDDDEEMAC